MRLFDTPLPIDDALPDLLARLAGGPNAVLVAPPGAGKTTRVPLVLLDAPWRGDRRIILLEPRRIAARAAAERMAATLGERVGETVGLRVRLGSKISARTRIEVVTEGVFARMVLDDPELTGIAAVLFDEFHERSLDADLGLALALDAQGGLREDLRLLVMSATLDGARVASLMGDAPLVESAGRGFPVETRHLPREAREPVDAAIAAAVLRALREEAGSVLAFLPGAGDIRRAAARLREAVRDPSVEVVELHGRLDPGEQDRAIRPAPVGHRKVVLATAIAETSLTIEGVRIVVDGGLARVPVHEPATGLTRLATVKVSRAAADQRRGRAGRTEPGICYRLWEEAATASLAPHATPEIRNADLSGLMLDLAAWGVTDPAALAWLDTPPRPAVQEGRALLRALDALDEDGRITARGRAIRRLPLPPRLAAMVLDAADAGQGRQAAEIAVLLVERGLGGDEVDLAHRLRRFRADRSRRAEDARRLAGAWANVAGGRDDGEAADIGALLARAYSDRVAQARGLPGEFRLANGRGAAMDLSDPLARAPFIVVADLSGTAAAARTLLAAEIGRDEIERLFTGRIESRDMLAFDAAGATLKARAVRRLGALVLSDAPRPVPASPEAAAELARGIAALGIDRLPWTPALSQWRDRVGFMFRAEPGTWPDLSDAALGATMADWLAPALIGKARLSDLSSAELGHALQTLLPHELARRLDRDAPTHFAAPSGSRVPISYAGEEPSLPIRVQELFGLDHHPSIAGGRVPLVVELLSPAQRPVQVTRDLPGFWRGSYAAVRREMRGRYPRHPWPEDPLTATATGRARPRGG